MNRARWLTGVALAGVLLALAAGTAAGAGRLRIVQAGGAVAPERSYILTLPSARALDSSQVHVTENGHSVGGLGLVRDGLSSQASFGVVIALDSSWSMAGKPTTAALAAARTFVATPAPNEQFALVTFNHVVDVVSPFTSNSSAIGTALSSAPRIALGTRIYDALERSLKLISADHVASGSIVIMTDGSDVGSLAKPAVVLAQLARAHVRVFAIGISSPSYDTAVLERLASRTGGSYVKATNLGRLSPILSALGTQLSNEYLLTYRSRANPGSHVKVVVTVSGLPGTATAAYVSPAIHLAPPAPYSPPGANSFITSPITMAVVVLIVFALLLYAIAKLTWTRESALLNRVGGFVSISDHELGKTPLSRAGSAGLLFGSSTGLFGLAQQSLSRRSWSTRLGGMLELAGVNVTVVGFLVFASIATLLGAIVFEVAAGFVGFLVGLVAIPYAAYAIVSLRVKRKRHAFAEQLPESLDVLASALRAGHSLVSALTVVADDAPEPSRTEYRRVLAEEQLGMPLENALQDRLATHGEHRSRASLARREAPARHGLECSRGARSCDCDRQRTDGAADASPQRSPPRGDSHAGS